MHSIHRSLLACVLAFAATTLRADDTNLVLRMFPVEPSFVESDYDIPHSDDSSVAKDRATDIKAFYQKCGVSFPEGAYLTYNARASFLEHYNTEQNQKLFGQVLMTLCPISPLVQLDAVFVDFPSREIEKLARANSSPFPRSEDILQLWKDGKGTLLHALKILTEFGVNAQVQAVSEHIYATEFRSPSSNSNYEAASPLPVPDIFDTREEGATFNVTPNFNRYNQTIQVVMAPELTTKPEWQSVSVTGTDAHGKEIHLSVPQPLFHSRNITTSFTTRDGATQVLGGMENPKGDGITYLFLTVTLLDASGQPLAGYAGIAQPE